MYSLSATLRTSRGHHLNVDRKNGRLPAVIYGPHRKEAASLMVDAKAFLAVWKKAGESSLITLDIEGEKQTKVLVHDIAFDPVKDHPVHVDFYEMDLSKPVTLHVPVHFEGDAPAEKVLGGVLLKQLHEIEISALPDRIPHNIPVDVSVLATFDDRIMLGDLKLPEGVRLTGDNETVIALVDAPRTEAEIASLDVEAVVDLEAIKREGDDKKDAEAAAEGEDSTEETT